MLTAVQDQEVQVLKSQEAIQEEQAHPTLQGKPDLFPHIVLREAIHCRPGEAFQADLHIHQDHRVVFLVPADPPLHHSAADHQEEVTHQVRQDLLPVVADHQEAHLPAGGDKFNINTKLFQWFTLLAECRVSYK